MNLIKQIAEVLREYSLLEGDLALHTVPILQKIHNRMEFSERLTFILPAFPAKSPSRDKTNGDLPDFGEVLSLQNLQAFCNRLEEIYSPGAEVVICSDGRVFSDVVKVDDVTIDQYNDGIFSIISEYNLHSISVFRMDDLYPHLSPADLRNLLIDVYAMDIEQVKHLVLSSSSYKSLFNGIHRFLSEDELSSTTGLSRSSAQKMTKERTYELLRRSDAWSKLLDSHYPNALRLSIHPHAIGHEKFGIKLVPSSNKWATPWHNVVVKIKNKYELMHKKKAIEMNATLKMERDKYAYFEIATI